MKTDEEYKIKITNTLIKTTRRIYVIAFNIYAWFWVIRLIFIQHSTNFEDYLLWFFATAGMYFFVLDGKDIFLKKVNNVIK
jgi:hypothetical protein